MEQQTVSSGNILDFATDESDIAMRSGGKCHEAVTGSAIEPSPYSFTVLILLYSTLLAAIAESITF
jgi:hypothetical protein